MNYKWSEKMIKVARFESGVESCTSTYQKLDFSTFFQGENQKEKNISKIVCQSSTSNVFLKKFSLLQIHHKW